MKKIIVTNKKFGLITAIIAFIIVVIAIVNINTILKYVAGERSIYTGDEIIVGDGIESGPGIVTITIYKDDEQWSDSGIKVGLYSNGIEKYSTTVTSGTTAIFETVEPGTYDVYAGKNSNDKTIMVDTGEDVTVSEWHGDGDDF